VYTAFAKNIFDSSVSPEGLDRDSSVLDKFGSKQTRFENETLIAIDPIARRAAIAMQRCFFMWHPFPI
jgi:hypothetical protein